MKNASNEGSSKLKQMELSLNDAESQTPGPNPPPEKPTPSKYEAGKVYQLPRDTITVSPDHSRKSLDEDAIASLAESIRSKGILTPILCTLDEIGRPVLVSGLMRLKAAEKAGTEKILALIVNGDSLEISLIENLCRRDLTTVEEAEAVKTLKERRGYSQETIARFIGKAVPTVSEILTVADLPTEILDECRADIKMSRAKLLNIARIKGTNDKKIEAFNKMKAVKATKIAVKRANPKTRPLEFLRSIASEISKISTGTVKENERQPLKDQLEHLMHSIRQILESIR